jgi:aspartyl aminopeptidase
VDDILDFELSVCDVQPATIGGLKEEFIFAGRLDNLCMSYTGLQVRLVHILLLPA